ncbi:zinc ribbon-containing protein [Paraburkholderia sp.]|uniref:zinc ribbon-containing protein n=1 Tax=Paraburkholderia sp. TaxID=1926495 RepID=UPI002F4163CF
MRWIRWKSRPNARCATQRAYYGRIDMSAKAGEHAQKTGDFRCEKCHHTVHVGEGKKIPKCPHCGNDTYSSRVHEPGNKSS